MNAKKYIVAGMVLNTVLLGFAISLSHHRTWETPRGDVIANKLALTGDSGKFGPVIDTVLPPGTDTSPVILDLETGRLMPQPPVDDLSARGEAIMNWIRSNGLDLSCTTWSGGAACVTHDMTILPVNRKCWDQTTEQEIINNPALAPVPHSPRRLLVIGNNHPDTYIVRTAEGTLGMLRIVGWSQADRGVKISYKLINPAQSIAGGKLSDPERAVVSR
jgi:hypothetical protein